MRVSNNIVTFKTKRNWLVVACWKRVQNRIFGHKLLQCKEFSISAEIFGIAATYRPLTGS